MAYLYRNSLTWIWLLLLGLCIGYAFLLKLTYPQMEHSILEASLCFVVLGLSSYGLQKFNKLYHPADALNGAHFGLVLGLSAIGLGLTYVFIPELKAFGIFWILKFCFLFLLLFIINRQFWIEAQMKEQAEITEQLVLKERNLTKAEINNLQQQFQPHFLFNSLNSISALVRSQPQKAREMIVNLSDFLRMSLQKGKEEFNTVEEEIEYLNLYMDMEKMRFADRLEVIIQADEKCYEKQLPSLILQPLVENAIKYGINNHTEKIQVKIEILCADGMLEMHIQNPFDPDAVGSKGTGYGLKSVAQKLMFLYERPDLMTIDSSDNIFKVNLKIPQA